MDFWNQFLSLSDVLSKFIHTLAYFIPFYSWMLNPIIVFICVPVDGHYHKEHATNIHAQEFVWISFQFSYIRKSRIAGTYGKSRGFSSDSVVKNLSAM